MPDIKDLIDRLQREAHPTIGGKVYDPRATRPRRRLMDEAASALSRLEKENAELREALRPRSMETAPKDGTSILIRFEHPNYAVARDDDKDRWAEICIAYWLDHNGGGWTWHGIVGTATCWWPFPALTKESIDAKG